MSEKVQQAIAATRAGQKRDAQLLLAEELEENPNNEHAWFLLSNLVDSPEKRKAYLSKALTINPQNEKARQQFMQVQRQITTIADEQAKKVTQAAPVAAANQAETVEEISALPDWLVETMEEPEEEAAAETGLVMAEEKAAVAEKKVKTTAVVTTTKTDKEQQLKLYNYILVFLVIFIIAVLIALLTTL